MTLFYAAACQTNFPNPVHRREIASRVDRMCTIIRQTVEGYGPFHDVRLFSFPEFAHAAPIHDSPSALLKHLAVEVPNEHTAQYHELCRELNIYLQSGSFLEVDPRWPSHVFNTSVLIGPEGILLKYRKVNPWIPWEVHASPHDVADYPEPLFPVADTEIGRIGVAICYDWLFPEVLRQLTFNGAEILVRVSAYMDPWGTAAPLDWWTLINRTRALENTAYVVASNQAADMKNYPPFGWPGGSMVVDYDGRLLAQADPGPGEKVVVAPINITQLREERARRQGHDMRAHTRSEAYPYLKEPGLTPAHAWQDGQEQEIHIESLKQRIVQSKTS
ncbi:MAG: nitrilase-related carbon-nitrogen hydrolase [Pseudomonadota bacterium]